MKDLSIAIVGLGYVGLPLAIEFSKLYQTKGFDINKAHIRDLQSDIERITLTGSSGKKNNPLTINSNFFLTSEKEDIKYANIYIITVPTPIDGNKIPDLKPLLKATEMVAGLLNEGNIVIFESTVYPGCTEEECIPLLESISGLRYNVDFFCGYSPERINVGDEVHTLTNIVKVTSGSTPEIAETIDQLYASIITAGTHKAPSIKVAEAAKAIENAQRDLNISFMNELALIFDKMDIDTTDVLDAASTKWNFLKFKPGLVGGHCIGVDPYYLTHKAKSIGYLPKVILSGRSVNENMGKFVAEKVLALLTQKDISAADSKILILGITFKENCTDIRNSGVIPLYHQLQLQGASVSIYDPWANADLVYKEYSVSLQPEINMEINYDAIILAVAHSQFSDLDYAHWKKGGAIIYDIKSFLNRELVDARL